MEILRYARCGYITTNEAVEIRCNKEEIKDALRLFDDTSDVARLKLIVNDKEIYLYGDKCSGYKRASDILINDYDEIISYACKRIFGKKRVQYYSKLLKSVKYYANK